MYPHIEAFTGIARRWTTVGHGERNCWWTQVVAYTGDGRSDARDERRWRLGWRLHKVELRQDGSLCTKMSQVLPRPVPDPDKDISPCTLHARHIHSPCSDRYRSAQSQGMTTLMTRRHMHLLKTPVRTVSYQSVSRPATPKRDQMSRNTGRKKCLFRPR